MSVVGKLLRGLLVVDSGCWEWQGAITGRGYGHFVVDGVDYTAHRAAYEAFVGPVPHGLMVLHRCDNRRCASPLHLFTGTARDNTRDMIAKRRRAPFSYASRQVKLTPEQVRAIRSRAEAGECHRSLSSAFGISLSSVSRTVNRLRWKELA